MPGSFSQILALGDKFQRSATLSLTPYPNAKTNPKSNHNCNPDPNFDNIVKNRT